ncbi:MAG TPA: hypothetical protein VFS43_28115 [Polyangiaceae bacterium]|nr:hypothetical protein [Polyangiaceae bacterium]
MAPTHRLLRPRALVASLALGLAACGSSGAVGRVRVPIAYSPVGPAKAEQCVATCRAHHGADVAAYGRCLSECPGAEIEHGQRCRDVREGPRAVCVEMAMHASGPGRPTPPSSSGDGDDDGGGGFVGALLGAIVGGAIESAVRGGGKSKVSEPAPAHEDAQAAPTAPPARGAAPPARVAAAPTKEHAKASPSRASSSGGRGNDKKPRVE